MLAPNVKFFLNSRKQGLPCWRSLSFFLVEACERKQGRTSPLERDHVRMGAVKKDMFLILYIMSIRQVTSMGGVMSPGHSLNSKGVGTKSEACHAANNITRKIKEHASRKGVRRMCDQGPLCREGAPLMVSRAFAVALSWMHIIIRCPIFQVPLPKVHYKMTKINGLTPQQPFLEQVGLCKTIHSRQDVW